MLAVQLLDSLENAQTGANRSLCVVAVCDRRAEDRHHGIADELLDDPAVLLHALPRVTVVELQDVTHIFRIRLVRARRRVDEVDEEDRHHFSLLRCRRRLRQGCPAATAEARVRRIRRAACPALGHRPSLVLHEAAFKANREPRQPERDADERRSSLRRRLARHLQAAWRPTGRGTSVSPGGCFPSASGRPPAHARARVMERCWATHPPRTCSLVAARLDDPLARSHRIAHHLFSEDGDRKIMIASLRYLDTFAKIHGRWYFAARDLILDSERDAIARYGRGARGHR